MTRAVKIMTWALGVLLFTNTFVWSSYLMTPERQPATPPQPAVKPPGKAVQPSWTMNPPKTKSKPLRTPYRPQQVAQTNRYSHRLTPSGLIASIVPSTSAGTGMDATVPTVSAHDLSDHSSGSPASTSEPTPTRDPNNTDGTERKQDRQTPPDPRLS